VNACALYSGGKDSNYALHLAYLKGFNIKCLITLKPRRENSWMFHYPMIDYTDYQAKALGLPQIKVETSGIRDMELNELKHALEMAKERYGVETVVTGALLSDYQRMNINMVSEELGLAVYSPLWRKNQEDYIRDIVKHGIKALIIEIRAYGLPLKFLGRIIDEEVVKEVISRSRKYGFNPAFEGGEAETFVIDAPLFKYALKVQGRKVVISEYEGKYIVDKVELVRK